MDQGAVQQTYLQSVLGQTVLQHIDLASLGVSPEDEILVEDNLIWTKVNIPEKVEGDWLTQVKVQSSDDSQLHLPDFSVGVGVVSDVDKVGDGGSVDLLDLGDEEHGGDTHQLQLGPGDGLALDCHEPRQEKIKTNKLY